MLRLTIMCSVFLLVTALQVVGAQESAVSVRGTVTGPNGVPIKGVVVRIEKAERETATDSSGSFLFSSLIPARYTFSIRHLGFQPLDTVVVVGETATSVRMTLKPVVKLDSVVVSATRSRVPGFDERRATGIGHFIDREELEKQGNRRVGDILARVPGARVYRGKGYAWIGASRGVTSFQYPPLDKTDLERGARPQCYVNVYIDGAIVYSAAPNAPLFDVNSLSPNGIEAMEFYSGPAQVPARYNRTNAQCGVLLIWTRR